MARARWVAVMGAAAVLGCCAHAAAKEITAPPGEGTISAVAADAHEGDVIVLGAGEYRDTVVLGAGVELRGAGGGRTRLVLTGPLGIECTGPGAVVRGLEIAGTLGQGQVGIYSTHSVRIEGVRLSGLKVGIKLEPGPLSDIVACEMTDCDVGVWGEVGSSPTVWGCRFEKCQVGVFVVEGAVQVRNCLFLNSLAGVQLFVGAPGRLSVVRNSVFWRCGRSAIELFHRTEPVDAPSIRNCIVYECGSVLMGAAELTVRTSHLLIDSVRAPIFRDQSRAEVIVDAAERHITTGQMHLLLSGSGRVTVGSQELVRGKGLRMGSAPAGTAAWIGLEPKWLRPGLRSDGGRVAVRFEPVDGAYLVNGVIEEEQVLKMLGLSARDGERRENRAEWTVEYEFEGGRIVRFDGRRYLGERDAGE